MPHQSAPPGSSYFYYPRLLCVVGVRDEARESANFAPVAWSSPLSSDPPLFGVCLSPKTHSHQLLLRSGAFTVNFLRQEDVALARALGEVSGREVDKVSHLDVAVEESETIPAPWLARAYAAAECSLVERHHLGDQTLCVGEVQRIHVEEDLFDEAGVLRLDRAAPLLYLGSNLYTTARSAPLPPPEHG